MVETLCGAADELTPQLLQTLYGIQAILAEVPTDRGTVRSLIVTEDME